MSKQKAEPRIKWWKLSEEECELRVQGRVATGSQGYYGVSRGTGKTAAEVLRES